MPRDWTLPKKPTVKQPSIAALQRGEWNSRNKTTDGCHVEEADGKCPHGYETWLIYLGVV